MMRRRITLLLFGLLAVPTSSQASNCTVVLYHSDLNRDDRLDQSEYVIATDIMSGRALNIFDEYFSNIPLVLQQTFEDLRCRCRSSSSSSSIRSSRVSDCCGNSDATIDITGASPYSTPTLSDVQFLNDTCTQLERTIRRVLSSSYETKSQVSVRQATPAPTPSLTQCEIAMVIADRDKNDFLDQTEYIVFVNRLSSNAFGSSFDTLPDVLQENYFTLYTVGAGIDVMGSKPGVNTTSEQQAHLDTVCSSTSAAISAALGGGSPVAATPTTAVPTTRIPTTSPLRPVAAPTNVPTSSSVSPTTMPTNVPTTSASGPTTSIPIPTTTTPLPTTSLSTCTISLTISDRNQNDYLDQSEYVTFVNRLSSSTWQNSNFMELPLVLQNNYYFLADGNSNGINLQGSKPGSSPTANQTANLENICYQTDVSIDSALNPTPTVSPGTTTGPSQSSPEPTLSPVSPVPTTSPATPVPTTSPATPVPTKVTSAPTTTVTSLTPTVFPTSIPSLSSLTPSGVPSGELRTIAPSTVSSSSPAPSKLLYEFEGENVFVISNTQGINAIDLNTGSPDRVMLDVAYNRVAQETVNALFPGSNVTSSLRYIRRRRLLINYKFQSGRTRNFTEQDCPLSSPIGALCQEVVAMFALLSQDEDSVAIVANSTQAINNAINDGELQVALTALSSPFTVRGSTIVVDQPSAPPFAPGTFPSASPSSVTTEINPTVAPASNGSSFFNAATIIGIVVGGVCAVCGVAGCWRYSKRRKNAASLDQYKSVKRNDLRHSVDVEEADFNNGKQNSYDNDQEHPVTAYGQLYDDSEDNAPPGTTRKEPIKGFSDDDSEASEDYDDFNPRTKAAPVASTTGVGATGFEEYDDSDSDFESSNSTDQNLKGTLSHDRSSVTDFEDYKFDDPAFITEQKRAPMYAESSSELDSDEESDSGWEDDEGKSDGDSSTSDEYFEDSNENSEVNQDATFLQSSEEANKDVCNFTSQNEGNGPKTGAIAGGAAVGVAVAGAAVVAANTLEGDVESESDSESNDESHGETGSEKESESEEMETEEGSEEETASESGSGSNEESGSDSGEDSNSDIEEAESGGISASQSDAETPVVAVNRSAAVSQRKSDVYTDFPKGGNDGPSKGAIAAGAAAGGLALGAGSVALIKGNKSETETEDDGSTSYTDSDDNTYEEGTFEENLDSAEDSGSIEVSLASEASEAMELARQASERLEKMEDDNSLTKVDSRAGLLGEVDDASEAKSKDMDDLVKNGDWDGILNSATQMEKNLDDGGTALESNDESGNSSESNEESDSDSSGTSSHSKSDASSFESGDSSSGSRSTETGDASTNLGESTDISELPSEVQRKEEIRAEVEALVRLVVPDEIENIDTMMAQFKGREEELLQTLRTMQERSVTARARAAVHKSKGRPPPRREQGPGYRRDGAYSIDSRQTGDSETSRGSAAGSAAIAAASIPRPATGRIPIHPPPVPTHEINGFSEASSPESQQQHIVGRGRSQLQSTSDGSEGDLRSLGDSDNDTKGEEGTDDESDSEGKSESENVSGSESEEEASKSSSASESDSESRSSSSESSSLPSKSENSPLTLVPSNNGDRARRSSIVDRGSKPWGYQSGSDDDGTAPGVSVGNYK